MKTTGKKDAFLILRVPQEFKDLLIEKALRAKVKLSKFVRGILEKHI